MGLYLWLNGVLTRAGYVPGQVVAPPAANRVRVSKLRAATAAGTDPEAYVNPRLAYEIGTYYPDELIIPGHGRAVGVLPDKPRKDFAGKFTATANNQVIEDLHIFGQVDIRGFTGVVIRNCEIDGPPNASAFWGTLTAPIVSTGSDMRGLVVEDSLIRSTGNFWVCAMRSGNYTLRRVELTNIQDGISFVSTVGNVTIEGCWSHNGLYSEFGQAEVDSGEHPAGGNFYTHVDGIQFHVGKKYRIRGNTIGGVREPWDHHLGKSAEINSGDDHYNAALMIKQEVSTAEQYFIDDVIIEKNKLWGGASTVNITSPAGTAAGPKNYMVPKPAEGGRPARVGVIIRNNLFPRSTWDSKLAARGMSSPQKYVLRDKDMGVFLDNFHEDGTPVTLSPGGNYVSAQYP